MSGRCSVVWAKQDRHPWWPAQCFDSWEAAGKKYPIPDIKRPVGPTYKVVKFFNDPHFGVVKDSEKTLLPFIEHCDERQSKVAAKDKTKVLQAMKMAYEYLRIPVPVDLLDGLGVPSMSPDAAGSAQQDRTAKRRLEVESTGSGKRARKAPAVETPVEEVVPLPVALSASSSAAASAASASGRVKKREGYVSFPDFFMGLATLAAMRSKDPHTQVGACIVNDQNRVVGIGYNGFPYGCSDDALPWSRTGETALDSKYMYVCHAEMNAILNKNSDSVEGCTLYVMLFPCHECAKMIIQSGIKTVIYSSDKYHDLDSMAGSRRMLNMAGVAYRQFIPTVNSVRLNLDHRTESERMLRR